MSEIDKSLPNVKQTISIPSPEEAQVEIQEKELEGKNVRKTNLTFK